MVDKLTRMRKRTNALRRPYQRTTNEILRESRRQYKAKLYYQTAIKREKHGHGKITVN